MNIVVDIPPQILLTILLSIDHSSRCKLKVYMITHTMRNYLRQIDIFIKIVKAKKVKRVNKIWVRMLTTNIHSIQFEI